MKWLLVLPVLFLLGGCAGFGAGTERVLTAAVTPAPVIVSPGYRPFSRGWCRGRWGHPRCRGW